MTVLAMTLLSYESEMKKPEDFEDEVKEGAVSSEERKLAETLIEAATAKDFDLGHTRMSTTRSSHIWSKGNPERGESIPRWLVKRNRLSSI